MLQSVVSSFFPPFSSGSELCTVTSPTPPPSHETCHLNSDPLHYCGGNHSSGKTCTAAVTCSRCTVELAKKKTHVPDPHPKISLHWVSSWKKQHFFPGLPRVREARPSASFELHTPDALQRCRDVSREQSPLIRVHIVAFAPHMRRWATKSLSGMRAKRVVPAA